MKHKTLEELIIEYDKKVMKLEYIIDKATEWVKKNQYYFPKPTELLEILGGKE